MTARNFLLSDSKILGLALLGIFFGFLIVYLGNSSPQSEEQPERIVESVQAAQSPPPACEELTLCQPATFGFQGETYEEAEARRQAFLRSEAIRRANAWPTVFVEITKKMKNPNSVKLPFDQAPGISAKTREVNGRRVCEHKSDKGSKSKQDKGVHIDRECCLDPDEIPNPRCYYPELGPNNSPQRVVGPDGKKYIK